MADTLNSIVDRSISEFEDDKIKRVGKNAFRGCEVLSSVTLPSVRAIGDKAFKDCVSLEDISVGMNYDGVVSVNDDAFDGCNPINVIVPKDKVDLYKNSDSWSTQGSICGMKDSITVNWGKCGGTSDVIATYKKGEGIWIPKAFLAQAYDPSTKTLYGTESTVYGDGSVGYYCYDWMGNGGYPIAVYVLPQDFGEWLYKNAEDCDTHSRYVTSYDRGQTLIYKGIAIYPDAITNWSGSQGWGVGIRKGSDINVHGWDSSTTLSTCVSSQTLSHYDADTYYMVMQASIYNLTDNTVLQGMLTAFNIDDTGTDHIWMRHFKDMTSIPSATNQGTKYDLDDSILKPFTLPLTVNWGKCGGTEDVIVNYDKEEGLWIPQEFLTQSYNPSTKALYGSSSSIYGDGSVGYYCYDTMGNANGYPISVYVLPQSLGRWLYENAESKTDDGYYGVLASDYTRAYKGIAIYPDSITSSSGWNDSQGWGVGIRTGADIDVCGYDSEGAPVKKTSSQGLSAYDDNTYYLVMQSSIDASKILNGALQGMISLFGDGKVYLRHWNTMTSKPNGTTVMGTKYSVPMSLPPDNAKLLGGRIFYIDSIDNGATYKFYDAKGKRVTGTTATELASAVYYVKNGTSTADKVYVYYGQATATGQWGSSNLIGTQKGIGTGKSNTATVLASSYSGQFWTVFAEFRENSGFDDLYVPSRDELLQLGLSGVLTSIPYGVMSSSESGSSTIYSLASNKTTIETSMKNTGHHPLAIRSF